MQIKSPMKLMNGYNINIRNKFVVSVTKRDKSKYVNIADYRAGLSQGPKL